MAQCPTVFGNHSRFPSFQVQSSPSKCPAFVSVTHKFLLLHHKASRRFQHPFSSFCFCLCFWFLICRFVVHCCCLDFSSCCITVFTLVVAPPIQHKLSLVPRPSASNFNRRLLLSVQQLLSLDTIDYHSFS